MCILYCSVWQDDLHIRIWSIFPGYIPDVQIWTSYVKVFENYRLTEIQTNRQTDRQTDTTEIIYHAASRVAASQVIKKLRLRLVLWKEISVGSQCQSCCCLQWLKCKIWGGGTVHLGLGPCPWLCAFSEHCNNLRWGNALIHKLEVRNGVPFRPITNSYWLSFQFPRPVWVWPVSR